MGFQSLTSLVSPLLLIISRNQIILGSSKGPETDSISKGSEPEFVLPPKKTKNAKSTSRGTKMYHGTPWTTHSVYLASSKLVRDLASTGGKK